MKSSIDITSNIILKSKYDKNPIAFRPFDLLPEYWGDTRIISGLQRNQQTKSLFYAGKIVDSDEEQSSV